MQNPDWRAQRHRRGRAMRSIANGSAKFSAPKLDQVLPLTATANGYEPTTKKLVLGRAPRRPPTAFAARRGRRLYESRNCSAKQRGPFPRKQPPYRGGRARRLPLGRPALRLLLPAFTLTGRPLEPMSIVCAPDFASRRQRALRRKPQLSCAERHLAPPGVAATRATLRVAIVLLAAQFSAARPEKLLRPTSFVRAPGEILPFQLIVETGYFPLKARRAHPKGVLLAIRARKTGSGRAPGGNSSVSTHR